MTYARSPGLRLGPWLLLAPAVVVLLVLMVWPVGQLLSLSFRAPETGELSLVFYERMFTSATYVRVLGLTFRCAFWTTVLSTLFSYPVAYLIATTREQSRAKLIFWILLPFWTSFLVRAFAWIVMLGRNGVINQFLLALGFTDTPIQLIYTFSAVMIGMLHALMPLCIVTMLSVMENIDGNLTRAARTLGARPGSAFWQIYFPLSLPGVAAGGLMVFITSLGFFIIPALLGGPSQIMLPQIILQQIQEVLNWPFAGALSLLLLVAAFVIFLIYDRVFGISTLAGSTSASAGTDASADGRFSQLSRRALAVAGLAADAAGVLLRPFAGSGTNGPIRPVGRWLLAAVCVVAFAFLAIPAFLMVPVSFTGGGYLEWPPRGFSLQWYSALLDNPQWIGAGLRSLQVAFLSAGLSMLVGGPAAFGLMWGIRRGNSAVLAFLLAPLIIPRIIIAVALFYLYAKLKLVGTVTGLVLGHTLLAIPYVVVTVMAVLKNYDQSYDRAAASLGANRWRTLRHVTLPLLRAGFTAAFLFAFITSFDELTIALFVTGGLATTLPKQMWDSAVLQVDPTLAAVSTLLLVLVTVVLLAVGSLQRRDREARG
jgi:putative spermidine/putrescine transport system permease protein